MSLKAKIEAVIYASEDPVTLAQLVGLLGEEAQAELDRADSAQGSLSLNEAELEPPADLLNETEVDLEDAAELDPTLQPEAVAAQQPAETALEDQAAADGEARPEPEASAQTSEEPQEAGSEESLHVEPDAAAVARAERARMAKLRTYFRSVLDALIADYATEDRGLEIREVAGGFRFATKPEYHDAVRGFVRSLKPPLKLSLQALETLAVIAYKQPVTAPEISEIRGVDSGGVLGSLMARKLITTAGRKQVIGRPILYKTTKDFLLKFGLKDINELPSIEEFERMAGQMAEQEEIPMPDAADPRPDVDPQLEQSAEKVEPERDVHVAQADGDSAPTNGESAPADNLEGAPEEKAGVDGRLPSLPPNYDEAELEDDPSAQEAEIQSEQGS
jgi:segregation and condensation protein B